MRIWNCCNIHKSSESLGHVPGILFNVPTVAGFPKNGVNVTERDITIAEEIIGIDLYVTCIDTHDIHGLIIELIL